MENEFAKMDLVEKQLDSTKVFDGRLLHVYKDSIVLPNGHKTTREYLKHIAAVAVVALDSSNRVVVEHQYRYPFHTELLEIPAGKLDSEDEDPLDAIKRELREETGITASHFEYLAPFYPSCAYTTEVIHLYLATGLSSGERELDDDESINLEFIELDRLVDMILKGEVPDGKTQAAVMMAYAKLKE